MKRNPKNITLHIVIAVGLIATLFAQRSYSQQAASTQVVTLRVMELNKIGLVGGPLTLQISSIDENATQPNAAIDAGTTLLWTSNGDSRKIAVGSDLVSPRFILKIEAKKSGSGPGVAQPEVTLSDNSPHDLILGVQKSAGSCNLRFTALATTEQGVGSESHLITYTITGG